MSFVFVKLHLQPADCHCGVRCVRPTCHHTHCSLYTLFPLYYTFEFELLFAFTTLRKTSTSRLPEKTASATSNIVQPVDMDAVEHCTVCWGVCGFASSRQNLDLAKSQEGITSFYQARDVIAASEQCRMCAFIVTRIKWLFKTISMDSNIATNVRFHKFKGASEEYLSVDTLVIRWNIDGKTLPWVETYGGAQWSILAYRGSCSSHKYVLM